MHEQKTEFIINDIIKSKWKGDFQILQHYNNMLPLTETITLSKY